MPRLSEPDPRLPLLAFTRGATASGLTADQVRQRYRSRRWERVAWGAYLTRDDGLSDLDEFAADRVRHVHRAVAAASRNPGSVIAYASAALIHGLPVLGSVPVEVTLAVPPGHWTGHRSGAVLRRLHLAQQDIVMRRVPVTSVARTWLDMSCRGTHADALAAGDAALRLGRAEVASLHVSVDAAGRLPGLRRARMALPLLDGLRETPLESASFAYFVDHRVPLPRMQVVVTERDGEFVARVDFLWDADRLVGEADGRLKYQSADDLYREKRREDALRALGYRVVRWGAADLRTADLARRLRVLLGA